MDVSRWAADLMKVALFGLLICCAKLMAASGEYAMRTLPYRVSVDHDWLDWKKDFVMMSIPGKEFRLYRVQKNGLNILNRIKMEDRKFWGLSPDGKFSLFSSAHPDGHGQMVFVYDNLSKLTISKTVPISLFRGAYWISNCQYVSLDANNPNGGVIRSYSIDPKHRRDQSCKPVKLVERELPESSPVFFDIQNFNRWAYFSNGARCTVNWIGDGNFHGLKAAAYPYFFFRERSMPGQLFIGHLEEKKILPLLEANHAAPFSEREIVALRENQLVKVNLKNKQIKLLHGNVKSVLTQEERILFLAGNKTLFLYEMVSGRGG